MQEAGAVPLLGGLLEHLDRFNHLAPGRERDDQEELAWPGIMGTASPRGVSDALCPVCLSSPLGGILTREDQGLRHPGQRREVGGH